MQTEREREGDSQTSFEFESQKSHSSCRPADAAFRYRFESSRPIKLYGQNLRYTSITSTASEWNAKFVFVLRSMPSLPVAAEGERGVSVQVCVRVGNGNDSKRVRSSRSSYGYTKRDSVVDFRRHLKCRRRRREGFTVRHATLATINCTKLPASPPLSLLLSLSVSLALFGLLFGFCLFACLKLIKTLCDCFALRTSFTVPC